ncbi:pyridoxal phosphate-dependent aminotransferase [Pseudomonas khavaziana]|uniref:pyridoxal phosphate-dependent aminotransferase n=1 Tax=Pseudomonas khavaziana TaxID=2842351 RepID=UPI001C3D73EA|nr:aminotransferase class I/II-fold pyridoxal phosphate-dependent enzyme [Pseudomonas khavaziana]MBV4478600.1 aminotransferase class I/II-fold pyridoxal phosphate-dependent enzyme [Pseudomonas khavaziana]
MLNPSQQLSKVLSEGPQISNLIQMHDGEFNLEVPPEVSRATIDALMKGHTGYCNLTGIETLKNALIERCFQKHSKLYDPSELLVSNGSSQALFMLMESILSSGDEVLIPNPCWPAYKAYINFNEGVAVDYHMGTKGIDIAEIRTLVTPRTKALIINSPHNPTGLVLSRQNILDLVLLSQEYGFLLISDEAYEGIIFGGDEYVSPLDLAVSSNLLVVTRTFSKLFSMSGFRIGYMFADRNIIRRCSTLQGVMTDNACTFAQHGALAAIALPENSLKKRVEELQRRAYYCHQLLSSTFDIVQPQGGFFLFPNISRLLGVTWDSDAQFVDGLLNVKSVSTTPGSSYGMKDHIRLSIASVNEADIKEACRRIIDFVHHR